MSNRLSDIIFRDLANNCFSISDYDFFRLIDFIKFQKTEFSFDLLLISFTSCYNFYLDKIRFGESNLNEDTLKKSNFNLDSYKEEMSKLCHRCKTLVSIVENFDLEILKIFSFEIKDMILTLLINDDITFSHSLFLVFSKLDPLFCLKLLKKNNKKLDDKLHILLDNLQQDYEQYEHLSYEIESILNSTISNLKYDLPSYNYLDFL